MWSGNETDKESQFTVTWTRPGVLDIVLGFGLVERGRRGQSSRQCTLLSSEILLQKSNDMQSL